MPRTYQTPLLLLAALALCLGCSRGTSNSAGGGKRQFLSMGTAPVGGTFPVVGGAIAEVLNAHADAIEWKVSVKGTKGSQENIRRLQQDQLEIALSNAAISYFAARGEATWTQKYDIRAVTTLAPLVALFVTRADSGIRTVADLKGKRVVTGPAGAGFEMFVEPILVEHGLAWDEITSLNSTQAAAVDQLSDGSADAAFLGGPIPASSIQQATNTFDVHFIPFDEAARQRLIEKYPFFYSVTIPEGKYKGLKSEFLALNVGSMHLITSASQDEELIYQLTKTIWEHRDEIAAQHAAGKAINEGNAARDTGIEYHPGAIRFYQEIGIWPEAAGEPAGDGDAPESE